MNTMQQEFDAVVEHLYKQGRPAIDHGGCVYRNNEGLMCAVGCRIPDDVYDVDMEERIVTELLEKFGSVLPEEFSAYYSMFEDLQYAHDNTRTLGGTFDIDDLTGRLGVISERYNLTFTPPAGNV